MIVLCFLEPEDLRDHNNNVEMGAPEKYTDGPRILNECTAVHSLSRGLALSVLPLGPDQ